ncbi:MAG: M56 family metallopeptidase [Candidatus Latescibacterota bacterium]
MNRFEGLADPGTAVAFLGAIALKAVVLVGLLGLTDLLLGPRRAAWRSLLWKVGFVGLLFLPVLSLGLPALSLPGVAALSGWWPQQPNVAAAFLDFALAEDENPAPAPAPAAGTLASAPPTGAGSLASARTEPPAGAGPTGPVRRSLSSGSRADDRPLAPSAPAEPVSWITPRAWRLNWSVLVLAGYGAGVLAGLGVFLLGVWAAGQLRHGLVPLTDDSWQDQLRTLCNRLSLRRSVCLSSSRRVQVPVQVGVLRPAVILPSRLVEQGASETAAAAITHELAHVARLDYAFNLLAGLALVLHWFNPLVWWAARRLRDAAEQACDDWSVRLSGQPTAYAEALVEAAMQIGRGWRPALSVPMAHCPRVVDRVERIVALDGRASPRVGRISAWSISGGLAVCIGLLAACAVQHAPRMTEPVLLQIPLDDRVRAEADSLVAADDREHEQRQVETTARLQEARQAGDDREAVIGLETQLILAEQTQAEWRRLAAETLGAEHDWQGMPWDERTGWAWRYGHLASLAAHRMLPAVGLYYCQQAAAANPYAWYRGFVHGQTGLYGVKWTQLLPELAVRDSIPAAQAVEWIEADLQTIGRLRYQKAALVGPDRISAGAPWMPDPTRQDLIDTREFAKRQQALLIEGYWVAYRWSPEPQRRARLQALLREHLATYYPAKGMERADLDAARIYQQCYFPYVKRLLRLAESPAEKRTDLAPLLSVDLARVPATLLLKPLCEVLINTEIQTPGVLPVDRIGPLIAIHPAAFGVAGEMAMALHKVLRGEYAVTHDRDPVAGRQWLTAVGPALGSTPPQTLTVDPWSGSPNWTGWDYLWLRERLLAGDLARLEGDEAAATAAYRAALDLVRPAMADWGIRRELAATELVADLRERLAARLDDPVLRPPAR